jgi:hypothetical protein
MEGGGANVKQCWHHSEKWKLLCQLVVVKVQDVVVVVTFIRLKVPTRLAKIEEEECIVS